ncbi:MAG: hypothetical protein Q4G43_00710 [Mobilicoccus sp.]|nr:hypothetical protein [Mobilicoccus sp.]
MTTTATPPHAAAAIDDATVTALLTSLFAGPTLRGENVTTARAAFQDALYERSVVIDLRPAPARAVDGSLGVDAVVVDDPRDALAVVQRVAQHSAVVLVSSDGVFAARIAAHLRMLGLPWVDAVDGGFHAWRSAGLPLAA